VGNQRRTGFLDWVDLLRRRTFNDTRAGKAENLSSIPSEAGRRIFEEEW
jgi:hypothetical protein